MKYNCLIIDDEKLLADSTAEYFNLFGVSLSAPRSGALVFYKLTLNDHLLFLASKSIDFYE